MILPSIISLTFSTTLWSCLALFPWHSAPPYDPAWHYFPCSQVIFYNCCLAWPPIFCQTVITSQFSVYVRIRILLISSCTGITQFTKLLWRKSRKFIPRTTVSLWEAQHSSVTVHWERFQENRKIWTERGVTVVFIYTRTIVMVDFPKCPWICPCPSWIANISSFFSSFFLKQLSNLIYLMRYKGNLESWSILKSIIHLLELPIKIPLFCFCFEWLKKENSQNVFESVILHLELPVGIPQLEKKILVSKVVIKNTSFKKNCNPFFSPCAPTHLFFFFFFFWTRKLT